MIKANSLLYAIFICLIVSIICGALLYFATLFSQLNLHYNVHEELYLHNQSLVNFALGNQDTQEEMPADEHLGISGSYESKPYGLLTLLLAQSVMKGDTVRSAQFIGASATAKNALYVSNFTKPLSFSGVVKIAGDCQLPSSVMLPVYIANNPNQLVMNGKMAVSERAMPEINPMFDKVFDQKNTQIVLVSDLERVHDSLYFNSFFVSTKEIRTSKPLGGIHLKGNFLISSTDSLVVRKDAHLEDVILLAPKIIFEEGFAGSVQAFATEKIVVGNNVFLSYPSVLCLKNETEDESNINIGKHCRVIGAIVLFGNDEAQIDRNTVEIEEGGHIFGDIYCSGKLMLKSKLSGSVYTNRFFYRTAASAYENTIVDITINALERPAYFIGIPLFESKKNTYGILKKVL